MSVHNNAIIEKINYCFSRQVDEKAIRLIQNTLQSMDLSESEINSVMLLFAAICAKHYKFGYLAAQKDKDITSKF